jgi:Protein of unknown function (DUF3309)
MIGPVLIVIVVLILIGGLGAPYWGGPYGYGFSHGGVGVIGLVLIILVILVLLGRL